MTILDCNVVGCAYNLDNSCKRRDIMVVGHEAKTSSETSCGSFAARGCGCATNSAADLRKDTDVTCEAVECIYNESKRCSAKHIGIDGGHADKLRETECGSFVCQ